MLQEQSSAGGFAARRLFPVKKNPALLVPRNQRISSCFTNNSVLPKAALPSAALKPDHLVNTEIDGSGPYINYK